MTVNPLESVLNEISDKTKLKFAAFGEVELFRLHNGKWRCNSNGFRATGHTAIEAAIAVLAKIHEKGDQP